MSEYDSVIKNQVEKIMKGIKSSIKKGEIQYYYDNVIAEETIEFFEKHGVEVEKAYKYLDRGYNFLITKNTNLDAKENEATNLDAKEDKFLNLEKNILTLSNKLEKNKKYKKYAKIYYFSLIFIATAYLLYLFISICFYNFFIILASLPLTAFILTELLYRCYKRYIDVNKKIIKNQTDLNKLITQHCDIIITDHDKENKTEHKRIDKTVLFQVEEDGEETCQNKIQHLLIN